MNCSSCSVMIHYATSGKSLLLSGALFSHLHHKDVGKVISETPPSNFALLITGDHWQHFFTVFEELMYPSEDILLATQWSCFVFYYHCLRQV